MKNSNTKILCEGAIMVALAQILGYIKLITMSAGGSVTLAMLPIFIFAYRRGLKKGLLASVALAILQCTLDGAYTWGLPSIFLDYIFAYGVLGISGLWNKSKYGIVLGPLFASLLRILFHTISGYLYVKEFLDLEIFGLHTTSPWLYSVLYNASYVLLSLVPCLIVLFILDKKNLLKIYM